MKTKFLFLFLILVSISSFAYADDQDNGQDGNGSEFIITEEERRLCKYIMSEMKDSKEYRVFAWWQGKHQEMTKLEIETKCCEINPSKCDMPEDESEN
jgi:hypothetical protein